MNQAPILGELFRGRDFMFAEHIGPSFFAADRLYCRKRNQFCTAK